MSEKAKQAVLVVFGVILIGGVIGLQVWRSRPAPPIVTAEVPANPASQEPVPPAVIAPPAQPTPAGIPSAAPSLTGTGTEPAQAVSLPQGVWGRNPFLTLDEIAAMQSQPGQIIVPIMPLIEAPTATVALPSYRVSVIFSGENGKWAVVNSRVMRPGELLGTETITAITDRGIILELNGQVREILIERPFGLRPGPPRGSKR